MSRIPFGISLCVISGPIDRKGDAGFNTVMTDILAQKDSYLKEFEATITEVNREEGAVALDRTAFFPGGGGQPHDLGWLAEIAVDRVQRQGQWIWHWLKAEPPSKGAVVQGRIDWQRRYRLMRTHTAFHILCGVVWRDYQALVTGGNMEELRGRMDFEFETLRGELVHEIEEKINVEVAAAKKIGRETVQYVSNIYKYYIAYRLIVDKLQIKREVVKKENTK